MASFGERTLSGDQRYRSRPSPSLDGLQRVAFGVPGGGGVTGSSGLGSTGGLAGRAPTAPQTKTAYTASGSPIDINADIQTSTFDPNVTFAGTHYFDAPPPRSTPAPTPSAFDTARTQSLTPNVQSIAGGNLVTQPAYEAQAQSSLEAKLAQEAATGNLAAQKELAELQATNESRLLSEKSRLGEESFARRLATLSSMGVPGGDDGSSGGGSATIGANEEAARSAAFGRAKDRAGQTALASLTALQNIMAERGLTGSTVEGGATADIIGGAAGGVNEFTRDELMADLNRAAEISDRERSAGLTKRGQDLSYKQSLLGLMSASGLY